MLQLLIWYSVHFNKVIAIDCLPFEHPAQCQNRLGDQWEVIYYTESHNAVAELKTIK